MPATPTSLDFEDMYSTGREVAAMLIAERLLDSPAQVEVNVVETSHDVVGPRGGTSSQILFTVEVNGQLVPVLAAIYAGSGIDKKIMDAAKERERMLKRDGDLREALGLTPSTRQPALAGVPFPTDDDSEDLDQEDA